MWGRERLRDRARKSSLSLLWGRCSELSRACWGGGGWLIKAGRGFNQMIELI